MKKTVIKETERLLILLGATGLLSGIGIVMNGTPITLKPQRPQRKRREFYILVILGRVIGIFRMI